MIRKLSLAAALALAASNVLAQEAAPAPAAPAGDSGAMSLASGEPRVGIGVEPLQLLSNLWWGGFSSINTGGGTTAIAPMAATIYVPVNVTPMIRLEPTLGHMSNASTTTDTTGGGTVTRKMTGSATAIGLGAFYRLPSAGALSFYAGARFGLSFLSSGENDTFNANGTTTTGSSDTSRTDWSIAAAFGPEYGFTSRFTLGAEAQLGFASHGAPTTTVTQGGTTTTTTDNNASSSATFLNAVLVLRFYM